MLGFSPGAFISAGLPKPERFRTSHSFNRLPRKTIDLQGWKRAKINCYAVGHEPNGSHKWPFLLSFTL
jgi:hypothetical protein